MKAPKIRFKGFEGAWEEKWLTTLSEISTWYPFDSKIFCNDWKYLVITNWNIQNDNSFVNHTIWNHINLDDKEIINSYSLKKWDILITMDWNVWRSAKVNHNNMILAQRVWRLKSKSNNEFIYQYLNTWNFLNYMWSIACWAIIKHISLSDIKNYKWYIPKKQEEQEKIWSLFEQIDSHISKNQQKLEKLKNMKHSFLQKLFPKDWSALPELRFKGFEGAWEERKLGEIFEYKRNNSLSRDKLIEHSWLAINIHYWDILVKYKEILNIQDNKFRYINDNDIILKYKWDYLDNWDIVIADAAEDETVGKCIEIRWKYNEIIISWLHTIVIRSLFKFGNGFLWFYLNSKSFHNQLIPLMQWIKVLSLSKSSLKNTYIQFPSLPEQEKIWTFFEKLDTQITQQTQKIQKLQNLKQSLLEKMFI